jgi:hypothetical protein
VSAFRRACALLAVVLLVALAASCSSPAKKGSSDGASTVAGAPGANDPEPWPRPPNQMALAVKAGLKPETAESLEFHVHAHLDVYINGQHIIVPAGMGIDINNPGVHNGPVLGHTGYGGINPPCDVPCISPLHTHDVSGVLHTESSTRKYNTLGQFFIEWGQPLSATQVGTYKSPATPIKFYENGKPSTGDPTQIALSDLKEIVIVIGTPPPVIPTSFDLSLI